MGTHYRLFYRCFVISTAELFGIFALIINFVAYRQSHANRYRFISACALAALSVHFLLLGAVAGFIVTAIAVARNLIAMCWRGALVLWFFVLLNLRSEEHTSELQSRPHLVCRLLLEKKKKITRLVWTGRSLSL